MIRIIIHRSDKLLRSHNDRYILTGRERYRPTHKHTHMQSNDDENLECYTLFCNYDENTDK